MTNPTRAELEKLIEPQRTLFVPNSNLCLTIEQQAITYLLTQIDALREALGTCRVFAGCELEYDTQRVEDALAQTEHLGKR